MANITGFDAGQYPADPPSTVGYLAVVAETEMSRCGSIRILTVTLDIHEGPHKGRRLTWMIPIDHPDSLTQSRIRARIAPLFRAAGILAPRDTRELHGRPVLVHASSGGEILGFSPVAPVTGE